MLHAWLEILVVGCSFLIGRHDGANAANSSSLLLLHCDKRSCHVSQALLQLLHCTIWLLQLSFLCLHDCWATSRLICNPEQ